MSKKNTAPRLGNSVSGIGSLLASLACILVGLVIGFIALLVLGWITMAQDGNSVSLGQMLQKTWSSGFKAILSGGFYSTANAMGMGVRTEILQAAPLIMTGLSVAFAFKTGLFNIGAAGQYTVGAYFAMYSAIVLKLPWWACLLASALGGAICGAIPSAFKAFLNVNDLECGALTYIIRVLLVSDTIQTNLAVVGDAILLHNLVNALQHKHRLIVVGLHRLVNHLSKLGIVAHQEPRVNRDAVATNTRTRLKDIYARVHVADFDDLIHIHIVVTANTAQFVGESDIHSTVGILNHLGHLCSTDISNYNLTLAEAGVILLHLLTNLTAVSTNGAVVM